MAIWDDIARWFTPEEYYKQEAQKQNSALADEFFDLYSGGANADELLKWSMEHPDFQNAGLEAIINETLQRESYGKNLEAMKEAGINPLVGLGNVSALGANTGVDMDTSVKQANYGNGLRDSNTGLSMIKNILLIMLALGKL